MDLAATPVPGWTLIGLFEFAQGRGLHRKLGDNIILSDLQEGFQFLDCFPVDVHD